MLQREQQVIKRLVLLWRNLGGHPQGIRPTPHSRNWGDLRRSRRRKRRQLEVLAQKSIAETRHFFFKFPCFY